MFRVSSVLLNLLVPFMAVCSLLPVTVRKAAFFPSFFCFFWGGHVDTCIQVLNTVCQAGSAELQTWEKAQQVCLARKWTKEIEAVELDVLAQA